MDLDDDQLLMGLRIAADDLGRSWSWEQHRRATVEAGFLGPHNADLPRSERPVSRGRILYGLLVIAVFASAVVFGVMSTRPHPTNRPEAVRSSGPFLASLDALVDASDLVVLARAVAVTDGRVFAGDSVTVGVRSQLVELEIGAVLAGHVESATITVEEEATSADGRPLIVDGLRPTRPGDQGFFFLDHSTDPATPYYATVSTAGRYLRRSTRAGDDMLEGAKLPGELPQQIAAMGGRRLTDAVVHRARVTQRPVGPLPQ